MKSLAALGVIPTALTHVKTPKCAGCMIGDMTRRPWRTRSYVNKIGVCVITKPGQCMSVDQMESPQVGFIAQMKGKLTTMRYVEATVFVDHY